jgi:uncharacterized membrane protein YhaH (DUF805 family)
VVFDGRAARSEYWFFMLFQVLAYAVAGILGGRLAPLLSLALFLPMLAVQVRRLHDQGRSGWFYLLVFIPLV